MKRTASLAVLAGALVVARACRRDGWQWVAHNVIAHPLLALSPPVGDRLHWATLPEDDRQDIEPVDEGPVCVGCGCTEARACPGGCWWAGWDATAGGPLCSTCANAKGPAPAELTQTFLCRVGGHEFDRDRCTWCGQAA